MNYLNLSISNGEITVIILFIFVILFCNAYLNMLVKRNNTCVDGGEHKWRFDFNSKGNTGDLGFGIKSYWEYNHYFCTKCNKKKDEEVY